MFSHGVMPPLMFAGMICFMVIGFPVAFSLGAVGMFFGLIGILTGHFDASFLQALPLRVYGIISNELLLAIPFFTFMGALLERCGLAEDLLEGTGQLFGPMPGGLAVAVILVGAILGAITGTVAASVIAMGVISLPVMMRYGYDMKLTTGVIAASGTITQLIPPSLVLVVLADQLGKSVGDMYLGAIGPSILQVSIFLLYILALAILRPNAMPPIPPEARQPFGWKLLRRVLWGMIPSIVLIFLVLGTIFMGLATPTEAGALGAIGALVLAAMHRRLTWTLVRQAMASTMTLTSMVVFILIGSTVFSLVFQGMDGGRWIEHMLTGLPGGQVGFLIFVNIFIFFLAFFLDFFEIAFIVIPLLAPVAAKLGIDLIWFGVLLCVNMQTSFMHPPFGFALFYLRGIAPPQVKSSDIYWGALPWVAMQLILVIVVIAWPESVTYWLDHGPKVDPNSVKIEVPMNDAPPPLKF
ncbi:MULTISPECIES: TRAP transporter large permease subunit [unclassified Beijerinckia]|uniref:TRAP transporter large permease n=1 Tax=unclassified Beijerinckia TaxID=2638183 RepID=UPI000899D1B3|nr:MULTISPECIES: TRAP transporter large permease subunit [unclassified Beijerinckia]MDH7796205.1 tripartite ATP-independent transporter DctM subunit [Beijerinckia sp. GAS462]SEC35002.1 TRAP transporter, DctM subunit [Beijerinckia sp. 28-YEA-48]